MAKIKTNFTVIVEPLRRLCWISIPISDKDQESSCKEIIEQIKQHVDNIGNVSIKYDFICEFCGSQWEETDEEEPFFCCKKAQEEYYNTKTSQK